MALDVDSIIVEQQKIVKIFEQYLRKLKFAYGLINSLHRQRSSSIGGARKNLMERAPIRMNSLSLPPMNFSHVMLRNTSESK